MNSNHEVVGVKELKQIRDIKGWLTPVINTPEKHSNPHNFLFRRNVEGKAEMFYRNAVQFPSRTQDLLAYLATIVHAARQYKGSGWQTYDTIFRQQAANDSTRKWADVNTSLWTTVFCNASPQDHCATCLCLDHTQSDCPTLQGSKVSDKDNTPTSAQAETTPPSPICMRFNSQECTSATCSFRHVCLECHGNHRRTRCPLTYRQRPYPNRAPKDKQTNAPPSSFRPRKGEERKNSA